MYITDFQGGSEYHIFNNHEKKWHARISMNKKRISIGYYDLLEDAKEARINKANKLFGE